MTLNSNIYPLISVIIPLYNKAPYIARALDSVLAQTVQDFEVIVVNDGSTDGSERIVQGYHDPRIHLINQENQGVSAARNRGVNEAQADLVAFLDADDEWLPQFLETIFRLREKYPEAGLYGTGYRTMNENGSIYDCVYNEKKGSQIIPNYFAAKNKLSYMIISTSGMAIPKVIFKSVGGFPGGYQQNEDRAIRGKIALNNHVAYAPNVCAMYYRYPKNTRERFVSKYISDAFSDYIKTCSKDELNKREDAADIREFCDRARLACSMNNIQTHNDCIKIRACLKEVQSPACQITRCRLYIMSYSPTILLQILCSFKRKISHLLSK